MAPRPRSIALTVGTGFLLAGLPSGCSTSVGAAAPTVTVTVTTTVTPPAPTATAVATPNDATAVADRIRAQVSQVHKVLTITEDNDPNDLIGQPTGYTSAAILYDTRTACSDGPGADCGATVEQWSDHTDAANRAKRIESILKASPIFGTEYDTVRGALVLRVAGHLKPSQAAAYRKAFAALF